jgi:UDPglucose 6-dehydrogenase
MHGALARRVVVDARNLYDPPRMAELGFRYCSIGRPSVGPAAGPPDGAAAVGAPAAAVPALA